MDIFRDLTGIKKSERTPKCLRNKSIKVKSGIAALIIASSVVLTAGIYKMTPEKQEIINAPAPKIVYHEQRIVNNRYLAQEEK